MPSRARVERDGSVLRRNRRADERESTTRLAASRREVERALAPTTRERGHTLTPKNTQFAQAQKDDNRRYLDIASVFDGSSLKGKRVAITGGSRGLGLEIAKAAMDVGAEVLVICRKAAPWTVRKSTTASTSRTPKPALLLPRKS